MRTYRDRREAGRLLAEPLEHLRDQDAVVLGLARGGVTVAAEVARALRLPLDVIVVRKLRVPFQPELAMGAVGEGGVVVTEAGVLRAARISPDELDRAVTRERAEVERRARRFRAGRPQVRLQGRTVILVDDGVATGSTARAACQVARALGAARVLLAMPVAAEESLRPLATEADEIVCLQVPDLFRAVGQCYTDFSQTTDDEVMRLLGEAADDAAGPPATRTVVDLTVHQEVVMDLGAVRLPGLLDVPSDAPGVVVFVHGSGSSRHSPRNRAVAAGLRNAGLGTLLCDLLTSEEERDRANAFDVELLAGRLVDLTRWVLEQPACAGRALGYFGASTGAAAALWAAGEPYAPVAAVVSRGGRPDLARRRLSRVTAPTLLVVGGRDEVVLELNREAQAALRCETGLAVVPGATHLFEEPGALRRVADLASDWFLAHLMRHPVGTPGSG